MITKTEHEARKLAQSEKFKDSVSDATVIANNGTKFDMPINGCGNLISGRNIPLNHEKFDKALNYYVYTVYERPYTHWGASCGRAIGYVALMWHVNMVVVVDFNYVSGIKEKVYGPICKDPDTALIRGAKIFRARTKTNFGK
jgi:hypothetical protein